MVSVAGYIKKEVHFFEQYIESLEMLRNEAISKEIASLDTHVKMDEEIIRELIKILKEKIGEIDRQYKKLYNREAKEGLDYWRERAVCELAFLYVLQEEYEEAIALTREEFERNSPLCERPFSNLKLVEIFFGKSEKFLGNYERETEMMPSRLARGISPSIRDKNMEWNLRAAFVLAKCLNKLWRENKQSFIDREGMMEKIAEENTEEVRKLTNKIKNIEGKIA